jgi:hypothetical protein
VTVPLELGIQGFSYADLFDPARLADLHTAWDVWFKETSPEAWARFDAYRSCKGEGMEPVATSEALLAAAPFVSAYVPRVRCPAPSMSTPPPSRSPP